MLVDLDELLGGRGSGRFPDGSPLSAAATEKVGCDARVGWIATSSGAAPTATAPVPGVVAGRAAAGDVDVDVDVLQILRRALRHLPPALGGLPAEVLAAGRTQRLVTTAQRRALASGTADVCSPAATDHRTGATRTT